MCGIVAIMGGCATWALDDAVTVFLSGTSGIVGCAFPSSVFTIPSTYSIKVMYY